MEDASGAEALLRDDESVSTGAEEVVLTFIDSVTGRTELGVVTTDGTGAFTTQVTIPLDATVGKQHVKAKGLGSGQSRKIKGAYSLEGDTLTVCLPLPDRKLPSWPSSRPSTASTATACWRPLGRRRNARRHAS